MKTGKGAWGIIAIVTIVGYLLIKNKGTTAAANIYMTPSGLTVNPDILPAVPSSGSPAKAYLWDPGLEEIPGSQIYSGLTGYYSPEGGALYSAPQEFGGPNTAAQYALNIGDPAALKTYAEAYKAVYGKEMPTYQEALDAINKVQAAAKAARGG